MGDLTHHIPRFQRGARVDERHILAGTIDEIVGSYLTFLYHGRGSYKSYTACGNDGEILHSGMSLEMAMLRRTAGNSGTRRGENCIFIR
jgi:hypothetical protein